MSDPDIDLVLARARRALSPAEADLLRVQAALPAELLQGSQVATTGALASGRLRWWHAPAGAALLGVAGVVGYGWGYSDGVAVSAAPTVAPTTVVERVSNEAPRAPAPLVQPAVVAAPPPTASVARASAPRAPVAVASVAPPLGLDEEVRQLRRIEKALRDGNPRLALAIGENLDAAIPQGQLREERSAARLMAQCQLGDGQAKEQARRFIADSAESAYAARLRQICKP